MTDAISMKLEDIQKAENLTIDTLINVLIENREKWLNDLMSNENYKKELKSLMNLLSNELKSGSIRIKPDIK